MVNRFSLLYRFSTDNGATWIDLTPQVDSSQTEITHSLCTNNFTSAKDEASFVMPETKLFEADGVTPTPKKLLIDALLGDDDVLIQINAPFPRRQVVWDDNDVVWNGNHVVWTGSARRFTGYADRSAVSLRSYPLPPKLTVKVQDCSVLHLDDKVDHHICWEDYTIKQIVRNLLSLAGYDSSDVSLSDADTTVMPATDNVQYEAFVIDKDKAQTYREYIDTLLFEAGGYVLDFVEDGRPTLKHISWDGADPALRLIDNPMNPEGVQMSGRWLKEDGARVLWSTLEWSGKGQRIYQALTNQSIEDGELVGAIVKPNHYWPDDGELAPQFFQYDPHLLDSAYLTRASRRQNEDLTIIMAKDISIVMDSMQDGSKFTGWTYVDPETWPAGDHWKDKYGIPENPTLWPTKAWMLLYNGTAKDVNLTFFSIYGNVLYRKKVNILETENANNPKEYESTYIFDQDHAERFTQFWWHFLQTSRYQFTWTEPNQYEGLNDIVGVGIKGNSSMQKAVIVSKKSKWINDNTEIVSFTGVGIDTYVPENLIPTVIAPSASSPVIQPASAAVAAVITPAPSYTLAEWEDFGTSGMPQTWTVLNVADFTVGSVAMIQGVISDMDNLPVTLYMDITAVDLNNNIISGTGIRIRYIPVTSDWDFDMSQTSAVRNDRLPNSYTDITLTAKINGHAGVTPYWTVNGNHSHFTPGSAQYASGTTVTLRVWADEDYGELTITMAENSSLVNPVVKKLTISNATVYDYNFGEISALPLPTHIDPPDNTQIILEGDYFVAGANFSSYTKGIPYMYNGVSSWNAMTATTENAYRMLGALATVLTNPSIQPSTGALYGWFENLTVIRAIIENLTAINLNVGTYGTGFSFRALTDDGNGNKVFDVTYNGTVLFKVNIDNGKIYFGQGFWYDPSDGAIRSTNDNVVIGAGGDITINNGLYKSNLQCPSFRSLPKDPPSQPTYLNVSGDDTSQFTTMYNFNHSDIGVLIPCLHSASSSVRYLKITYDADGYGGHPSYDYDFLDSSGNKVGSITGYLVASYCIGHSSTWENTSFTLTLGNPTDVAFQLLTMDGSAVSIGTLSSDTRKGELYYVLDSGGATGTVHIKL